MISMLYRRATLLLVTLFLSLLSTASPNISGGRSYELKNSLPNLHIKAFAQDKAGYVWIATAKGLCRYNGYEHYIYTNIPENPRSILSDMILSIFVDSNQVLWISTNKGICRYNYETDDFSRVSFKDSNLSFLNGFYESGEDLLVYGMNGICKIDRNTLFTEPFVATTNIVASSVIQDNLSNIWIAGVLGQGIQCGDSKLTKIRQVVNDPSLDVFCSYKTEQGQIWFGTNKGIIAVNPATKRECPINVNSADRGLLSTLYITFIHNLTQTELLLGTENRGLFLYNTQTQRVKRAEVGDYFSGENPLHLTSCYTDKDDNIWFGTFENGYYLRLSAPRLFNDDQTLNTLLKNKFVTRVKQDQGGNLWIGTRQYGIIYYDTKTKRSREYNRANFKPFGEFNNDFVQSLLIDSKGDIWVGYDKSLVWLELSNNQIVSHKIIDTQTDVVTLCEDDIGRIWAGSTYNGLSIFDITTKQLVASLPMSNKWNNVTKIIKLSSGEMMYSVFGQGVFTVDPKTLSSKIVTSPKEVDPYLSNAIFLFEDRNSQLWIGTYGRGVARYNRDNLYFDLFTTSNGLPSNDALAITEDVSGNVWISTSYGITRYSPRDKSFSNYYQYDGIGGNQFHEKCFFKSANGKIYFGGNHGLTYFDPSKISIQNKKIDIVLEDIKVLNISEPIGGEDGVLSKHISSSQAITLNHKQNIFSIDYSGIYFGSTERIRYAYRLRNFEKEWNYVDNYRRATYSNLDPGIYYFEVKAQNFNYSWDDTPTVLAITIKASPWLTSVAKIIYILLTLGLLWLVLNVYVKLNLNRERLALIEKERQHESHMTSMKIKFFTNISHEIRTPLSMIYGPVKRLMEQSEGDGQDNYLLRLINYNADRLMRLIDQLMDFARLDSDTLELTVSQTDIMPLVENLIASYSFFAQEKNIEVKLISPSKSLIVLVDSEKIIKILGNLLSNALKYTPDNGHIEVVIKNESVLNGNSQSHEFLTVSVVDDGIGISDKDMLLLFSRFRRLGTKEYASQKTEGKGVGLNYVKSLVEKHKGSISAEKLAPHGMNFTFTVPTHRQAYTQEEMCSLPIKESYQSVDQPDEFVASCFVDATLQEAGQSKAKVLVAEDNPELRDFLRRLLEDDYQVFTASDGQQGYEICKEFNNIDLIISDVVMPGVDGFEFCKRVKNDPVFCHIPFVILTAKTMDVNQIEGYLLGTDAYINKPFNPLLLKMVISNILKNVARRKTAILSAGKDFDNSATGELEISPLDSAFLEKLYAEIDKRLSDTSLNVSILGKELAFSRTGFYVKVKNLTGQSPIDLLRIYRLNKAADLIKRREYSISEIAFMTGFGSHSHFSLCFKRHFGVSPNRYIMGIKV